MKTIIITGATGGIGLATAKLFNKKSWNVIATARNTEKLKVLERLGIQTYVVDITKSTNIDKFVNMLVDNNIKIDVLVNNAGYGQFGTVEETNIIKARQQFETNVFGLAAITQRIVPIMRKQKNGRIINISSIAGKTSMPGGGWYAASKHAVEALSDSLRWETNQFGIKVSIIEPGPIKTDFAANANKTVVLEEKGPYGSLVKDLTQSSTSSIKGGTVEECAAVVFKAATKKNPKNRYLVTKEAKLIRFILRFFPPKLVDYIVIKMFIPKN